MICIVITCAYIMQNLRKCEENHTNKMVEESTKHKSIFLDILRHQDILFETEA